MYFQCVFISIAKWRLSPILIYDEDKILDSRKITLEGWGKTFTLLATASIRATNDTKVVSKGTIYEYRLHVKKKNQPYKCTCIV